MPPVPLAFPTAPPQARTLAPRRLETKYGQGQKKGHPGSQGVLSQDLSNKMHAGQGEPGAVHLLTCGGSSVSCHWALLSCPVQFTAVLQKQPRRRKQALSHLGRENQRVSNFHQTNHRIMTGINQSLSLDPCPAELAGRKESETALPPLARRPESR